MKKVYGIILVTIAISVLLIGVGFIIIRQNGELACYDTVDCPPLEFPVGGGTANITGFSGFNVSGWGGPGQYHNGMDFQTSGYNWTLMNACAPGEVTNIFQSKNPYTNQTMFSISIEVAPGWDVTYVLEPGVNTSEAISLQEQYIYVVEGQCVETGQTIARLLDVAGEYTHLHFMVSNNDGVVCPYSVSSAAAKVIYDALATTYGKTVCCTDPGEPGC